MPADGISRKSFVKGLGLGAAALSASFPAFIPKLGEAAEVIKIGQVEELTGVYAAVARNEVRGAALAADWWNRKGGVLGRKVQVVVEDNQNNPGVSVEKTRKLINEDKVVGIIGALNSGASLATSNAANSLGAFYIGSGHSDIITGKDCHWGTFQTCHTTWQITQATGFSIAKLFGKKWYLITPDYAFGHSLADGYAAVAKRIGGSIVANDLTPLGTSDFSPYLTKIAAAKPDCVLALVAGGDWVNLMKQAGTYGVLKSFPVAGPYAEVESVWAAPPEVRVGYWGTEWWYKSDLVLGKKNELVERFVSEYRKLYNEPPTPRAAFAFTSMDRTLWAIHESRSTDPVKMARSLEGAPFNGLWEGRSEYRKVDHALQWPMWFGKLNPHGTPEDPHEVYQILDRREPAGTVLPAEDAAKVCNLRWPA